jgi:hypothetical protein
MDGLLLIDCGLLQLCNALESSQYVALNYVWGKQVPRESTKSPDIPTDEDWHLPRFERLSQVVKDAILVTKRLGYRYLWVDKYCINQHDAAMKDYQIDSMHLVYMGAELTIIAAAGDHENCGLPGVGTQRALRPSVEIGNFTAAWMPCQPWYSTSYSPWAERAWT